MDQHEVRRLVDLSLCNTDELALLVTYLDLHGRLSKRTVSPIRYLTRDLVSVYCLGRENCRSLYIQRCMRVELRLACDVLAPEQLIEFQRGKKAARDCATA